MTALYGGTYTYFDNVANISGIKITYVNVSDLKNIIKAISSTTKMVYLESPTNPSMNVIDIPAVVKAVRATNPDIMIVMDNTFTTPYFMRPLDLGVHQSINQSINQDFLLDSSLYDSKHRPMNAEFQAWTFATSPWQNTLAVTATWSVVAPRSTAQP